MLFGLFRRCTVALFGIFSMGCLVAVFGARLADDEICVMSYDYYTTQPGKYGYSLYDTTRGQYTRENRNRNFSTDIPSPDGKYYAVFKPMRHETDLYDIYLQPADYELDGRLLQSGIWISSGGLQSIGDQLRWSPDSKRIAFLWSDRDKNVQLTVANVDNNQTKTVTPFAKDPSKTFYSYVQEWSADNHYFTVIEQMLNDTYYSFWDSDTLEAVSYPFGTTSMVRGIWSPQGHSFASILRDEHHEPTDLMILNPDAVGALIKVPIPRVNYQHLMWSPDSSALVLGNLGCTEANCQQRWYYDLFRANGETIASDLTGSIQNSGSSIGNTLYSYSGRTIISGYSFNAMWSDDGKRFVYLEQVSSDANPIYSLKAIDIAGGQTKTVMTYPTFRSINSFFHISQNLYFSNRILEGIPYVPKSDQVILPYIEAGKVNVALTGSEYEQPIILVHGADHIEPQPDIAGQRQYWVADMYDTAPIMIQWAIGTGAEKRIKITTANSDGGNIHTFDDGWNAINNINFIMNANVPMMGFAGKKDGQFNLYLINIETGELTLALENVQDVSGWTINMNPQQTLMAVNAGSSTAGKGALYLRSIKDDTSIEIDPNANTYVAWSNDGEKLALTSGLNNGQQHLRIVSKNGKPISDNIVSDDGTHLFIPIGWSKCY